MKVSLVSHYSVAGRWQKVYGAPDRSLRPYLVRYQGYHEALYHRPYRRELPAPSATLVIGFGRAIEVLSGEGRYVRHRLTAPFVVGPTERASLIRLEPGWKGLIVDMTPIGARMICGMPVSFLANKAVRLADVLGPDQVGVEHLLEEAAGWSTRFRILDDFFRVRLEKATKRPLLARAWSEILSTGGRVRVGALASELGVSHGRLIDVFRDGIGLPPKRLARLVRCDRALHLIAVSQKRPRWTQVAYCCGFYDQAHLINEVRTFTGLRPTEFAPAVARDELSSFPSWNILRRRLKA